MILVLWKEFRKLLVQFFLVETTEDMRSEDAQKSLNLKSSESRREELWLKFVKKSVKSQKFDHWFVEAEKTGILTRSKRVFNGYKPTRFRTERCRNSPLPFLTSLLNKNK